MNCDRGFKRITLILSIVGALIGAGFYYYILMVEVRFYEKALEKEHRAKFVDNDGSYLIREWKKTDTRSDQNYLWEKWTGSSLNLRPYEPNKPRQESIQLSLTEEQQQLKVQGWIAATGEPLPLTPMEVRNIRYNRTVRGLEEKIQKQRNQLPKALVLGSLIGFSVLWAFYAVIMWGALPLYRWIYIDETLSSQSNQTSPLPTQGQLTTKLKVNYNANSQNDYHEKSDFMITRNWLIIVMYFLIAVVAIAVSIAIFGLIDVLIYGTGVALLVALLVALTLIIMYCGSKCPKCGKNWSMKYVGTVKGEKWYSRKWRIERCDGCGYEIKTRCRHGTN